MISDEILENAWMRARAECECRAKGHGHGLRCAEPLFWEQRGESGERGAWEVLKTGPARAGWQAVNQCVIVCWRCYQHSIGARNGEEAA